MQKTNVLFALCAACALQVAAESVHPPFPAPPVPEFPRREFLIPDFGASPDGAPCTAAFAGAIEACVAAGGGRVVVPQGTWHTGPIRLKSGVDLHLDEGAVVLFSDNPSDYLPPVPSSWEGLECLNLSPLVYAYGCTNVAITGKGVLRPKMDLWRELMKESRTNIQGARALLYKWGSEDYPLEKRDIVKAHPAILRPQCLQFNRSANILLEGVRVEDSPFWTIHLFMSENVTIRGVDVCAHGFNNDGVDIEMTRNVLIEDSVFDQGDDGFVFKAGRNRDAWRVSRPTENVEVRNCRLKKVSSLIGVGSELSGGVRNVYVHDCIVEAACNLFFVKTNRRRGGFVEDIRMENVRVGTVVQVFAIDTDVLYQWRAFPDCERRLTPISRLSIKNVVCENAVTGVQINGDPALPVRGVEVKNVRLGRLQEFLSKIHNAEDVSVSGLSFDEKGPVERPWNDFDPLVRPRHRVAFLGDSITDAKHIGCRLNYWNFLADDLGIEPLVHAVNGRRWDDVPRQVAALRSSGLRPEAVCILMGTNDYMAGVPLGEWYRYSEETVERNGRPEKLRKRVLSDDVSTLRGRINVALRAVRDAFPVAPILLMTPLHRGYAKFSGSNVQPDESYANPLGLFIDDYVAAIAEAGRVHSVVVVDLHSASGIYPLSETHARDFFNSDLRDGRVDFLHPNTAGHRRIADVVRPVLSDLLAK